MSKPSTKARISRDVALQAVRFLRQGFVPGSLLRIRCRDDVVSFETASGLMRASWVAPCTGGFETDCCIPIEQFLAFVKGIGSEVDAIDLQEQKTGFVLTDQHLKIRIKRREFDPDVPMAGTGSLLATVDATALLKEIADALCPVAEAATNDACHGIHLAVRKDKLVVSATDSFHGFLITLAEGFDLDDEPEDQELLVPPGVFRMLSTLLDEAEGVTFERVGNGFRVSVEMGSDSQAVIEGPASTSTFPDLQQLLQKAPVAKYTIAVRPLITEAKAHLSILADGLSVGKMTLTPDGVSFLSTEELVLSSALRSGVVYLPDEENPKDHVQEFGIRYRYLVNALSLLKGLGAEQVTLEFCQGMVRLQPCRPESLDDWSCDAFIAGVWLESMKSTVAA